MMNDQKPQPGQRSVQNEGDNNIIVTGNQNTVNVYNMLPERSPKHQLRAPVGDFVGRETEIAELTAELTNGGQVAISGISGLGGIGKTELALVVANRLLPNYPDAQLLVELRGTDPQPRRAEDALADCVRAFIGVEARLPDDLATLVKLYRDSLSGKRVLVLLDNAADADQVRPFLVPAGCALLVTSRETISLPKMKRIRLEQLPPDKARELLQEIAPRVPSIDAAVADQICFLCGYLPLAVRAAASLLDVTPDLDPADYAAELRDERRRLEAIGTEGVEISVEASFNLSYARLSLEAALVFRSLSVFPASFDAAAEEAICQDAGHKLLSDLLRRNLVIFDEAERRYRLHDLARVFANAQLGDDEREALKLKHACHFCDLLWAADDLYKKGGRQVSVGVALYDFESANIAAGQAWAASRSAADGAAAQLCIEYPNAGIYVIALRLHPREWIRWLEAQLFAARRLKLRNYEAVALSALGLAYGYIGETRKAIEFHELCLAICREVGHRRGAGSALGNLGIAYKNLGETHKAIKFYEQALIILREIEDRRGESSVLGNLGVAYNDLGDTRKAIEFHESAWLIDREANDRLGECNNLGNLGVAYKNLGETRKAIGFYEQQLAIAREIGHKRGEGIALWNLALALDTLGDRESATTQAEAALKIYEEIESPRAAMVREQLAEWRKEE